MEKPSRLFITRKNGESFVIGDSITVTLHKQSKTGSVLVNIRSAEGPQETLTVKFQTPFNPCEGVAVIVSPDGRRGSSLRVMIEAPRHVRVLRSELLSRASAS